MKRRDNSRITRRSPGLHASRQSVTRRQWATSPVYTRTISFTNMSFAPRPLTRLFAASTRSISQRAPSSQATRIKFSVGTNPFSPRLLLPSSSSNFPGQATFSQKRTASLCSDPKMLNTTLLTFSRLGDVVDATNHFRPC